MKAAKKELVLMAGVIQIVEDKLPLLKKALEEKDSKAFLWHQYRLWENYHELLALAKKRNKKVE